MASIKTKLTDVYNALTGESKKPHEFKSKADVIAKISENVSGGGGGGTVDAEMSDSSTNAVQNKAIKAYVDEHGGSVNNIYWNTSEEEGTWTFELTYQELYEKVQEVGMVYLGYKDEQVGVGGFLFQVSMLQVDSGTYYASVHTIFNPNPSLNTAQLATIKISGSANDAVSFNPDNGSDFIFQIDNAISSSSENAVQNKAVKSYVDDSVKCVDVAATLNGSVLTLDMTHGELQEALDGGKVVRGITEIGIKVFSLAMGYEGQSESSNVAYFLSFDGTNNTPMLMISNNGALTDNVTFNLSQ